MADMQSFRAERSEEPGIHIHGLRVMDSGFASSARPGMTSLYPGPRCLGGVFEAADFALLLHRQPDIVEAVKQAFLPMGVDVELDHAAVGTADFLFLEIDGQRRIGAA